MNRHVQGPDNRTSLGYFVRAVLRYRSALLWCNLTALIVVSVYATVVTPTYRARAVLLVEPAQVKIGTLSSRLHAALKSDEFFETQFQLLRSPELARAVIDTLQLWKHKEFKPTSPEDDDIAPLSVRERQWLLERFTARLRIKSILSTSLITVQFDSADRMLATEVVNTLADRFIERNTERRYANAQRRVNALDAAFATQSRALAESEGELRAFRAQYPDLYNDGQEMSEQESSLLGNLPALAAKRNTVQHLQNEVDVVTAALDAGTTAELPTDAFSNDALRALQSELSSELRTRALIANRYGKSHPDYQDAQARIRSLERSLEAEFRTVAQEQQRQLALAEQQLQRLNQENETTRRSLQSLGTARHTLQSLRSRQNLQQRAHRAQYKELQAARHTNDILASEATVAERATVPALPFRPHRWILTGLAMVSALIFSVIGAGIAARLDNRVKSYADLTGLRLQALGIIPRIGKPVRRWRGSAARRTPPLIPDPGNRTHQPVREAVDSIRTVLLCHDTARQAILVTSSVPGEGKSSLAIALAAGYRRAGERVLLMDCDLRRPGIAAAAGIPRSSRGLSSILTGDCKPSTCISANQLGLGIDYLGAGPATNQPGQLLASRRFAVLLKRLRKHYDRIIVDSAPVLPVSDALPLSRFCDSVVYAIHSHQTRRPCVGCGIDRLRAVNAPLAGFVLTQQPDQPAPAQARTATRGLRWWRAARQAQHRRQGHTELTQEGTSLCRRLHNDLLIKATVDGKRADEQKARHKRHRSRHGQRRVQRSAA